MSVIDTSDRYASRERMVVWDAGACAVALAGASPQANCQLPSKNGDFWECWYMLEEIRLQRIVLCE